MTDKWYLNGDYLLGLMVLCVHIPLGMLKKIDFLGFTSFIGMACMSTFVFMVIKKVTDPPGIFVPGIFVQSTSGAKMSGLSDGLLYYPVYFKDDSSARPNTSYIVFSIAPPFRNRTAF